MPTLRKVIFQSTKLAFALALHESNKFSLFLVLNAEKSLLLKSSPLMLIQFTFFSDLFRNIEKTRA